ncbi:MAG: ATP-binding protein [Chlamydiia bacterium]|nr:ATP-binding protein [Chlamydiia bacterium]
MQRKIARLSEEVINQIAAGEVVENPASVIKELLENSLDAGARHLHIAIERGGLDRIRIEDDGCGMDREDALLSLERHATSKIRTGEDLMHLFTMGFRGEALAAIASISQFQMTSATEHGEGTKIQASTGKIMQVEPVARNRGTTIEVRALFANVPARQKFQKSAGSSTALCHRVVETLSLAHPECSFTLHADGKCLLEVESETHKSRIERILGPFAHELQQRSMWGSFAAPSESKTHRRNQFLFVNLRPIFLPSSYFWR